MRLSPMPRWILVMTCATTLLAAPGKGLREKAVSIPIGNPIEVRLLGNDKIKGQLVAVSNSGVTIRTVEAGQIKELPIAFDKMRSITNKKANHTALKIVAGGAIAFCSLLIIGVIVAITH